MFTIYKYFFCSKQEQILFFTYQTSIVFKDYCNFNIFNDCEMYKIL